MSELIIGVLRGGPSSEYEVSLQTGKTALDHLPSEKYRPLDIFIDRKGAWHVRGMPAKPERVLSRVDAVFNALHGAYGEDGTVQELLDRFSVPYTGSGKIASVVAMNKLIAKERAGAYGIKTPRHVIVDKSRADETYLLELFRTFPQPSIVKPVSGGSSVGVTIAKSFEEFMRGVETALQYSPRAVIEEYIDGREATCGVLDSFRGEHIYALPPIEIVPPKTHSFFDYEAKYGGGSDEICPGNFTEGEKRELEHLTVAVHQILGLRHYSRSDFIVSRRGIYFLEANTLPGITAESLVPKELAAVGCTLPDFFDHVLSLALARK